MKKIVATTALALSCSTAFAALTGHNGISFEMTQKQVEAKGFNCAPPKKPSERIIAVCRHMEMKGTAFGYPTKNYRVDIGVNKRVANISTDLEGMDTFQDHVDLQLKVEEMFPKKDEAGSHSMQDPAYSYVRTAWRDTNNAGISVFSSTATQFNKKTESITFYSPADMKASDKIRARDSKKEMEEKAPAAE